MAAQRAWLDQEAMRRKVSNRRIRAVADARDAGMSMGEISRAMSSCGRVVRRGDIPKILACGYPEDEPESEPAA